MAAADADALHQSKLRAGTYEDDGSRASSSGSASRGIWTLSPPLTNEAHLSGSGRVVLDVTRRGRARTSPSTSTTSTRTDGPLITRQGASRQNGAITLDLWSADWKIPAGHPIGVRVTDTNAEVAAHAAVRRP